MRRDKLIEKERREMQKISSLPKVHLWGPEVRSQFKQRAKDMHSHIVLVKVWSAHHWLVIMCTSVSGYNMV